MQFYIKWRAYLVQFLFNFTPWLPCWNHMISMHRFVNFMRFFNFYFKFETLNAKVYVLKYDTLNIIINWRGHWGTMKTRHIFANFLLLFVIPLFLLLFSVTPFLQAMLDPILTKPWHFVSTWLTNDDPTPFDTAHGRTFWDNGGHEPMLKTTRKK